MKFKKLGLLGVTVAILILLPILVPSCLNQANEARQEEGKVYVNAMNRVQQAAFLESGNFYSDIPSLGLGIDSETPSYRYKTQAYNLEKNSYAISTATPKMTELKSYTGGTFVFRGSTNETIISSILCESKQISATPPPIKFTGIRPQCSSELANLIK